MRLTRTAAARRLSTAILGLLATGATFPLGAQPPEVLEIQLRRGAGVELGEELELLLAPADERHPPWALNASGLHRIERRGPFAGRVGCESERLWCPWRTVAADDSAIVLPVFRAGRSQGRVAPTREGAPDELVVEGTVDVPGLGPVHFREDLATTDDGRFALVLPQAELDLRFSAAGWAPLYRWSVRIGETTDLGSLRFARGSSISGFVRDGTTELPAAGATVTALPASAGELDAAARARLEALVQPAPTDPWGFFQLGGLPPGRYRLRIEKDGFYPARAPLVEVVADSETRLSEAIDLLPAVRVSFAISPRRPREGEGWQMRLVGNDGGDQPREAVADEESASGSKSRRGLGPCTCRSSPPRWA